MDSQTTVIDSAEVFWGKVEEYLKLDKDNPGQCFDFDIVFAGWPNLHINVKGDKFHSSLTSSMVAGLTSMHESFQRAYAVTKYGTPNLQRLTNEDRQSLDIIFKIKEGSTDSDTDWSGTINNAIEFLKGAFEGMTGIQKMTVLIALITALTVGGSYYLNQSVQSEAVAADATVQSTRIVVDGMNKAYELANLAKQRGETALSREIENHGEAGKSSLIKSVASDAERITVGQDTYTGAQLRDYTSRQSVDRERKESFDNFYIKGIQRAGLTSSELNLTVVRVSNGESFTMKVAEDIARPEELEKLAKSIVSGEVIRISYLEVIENGHVARGQFNLILENQPTQQPQNPS